MIMARDQWGNTVYLNGIHPRKELMDKLGATHCIKQYVDKNDGSAVHNGYIIGQSWFTLYNVTPWERNAE